MQHKSIKVLFESMPKHLLQLFYLERLNEKSFLFLALGIFTSSQLQLVLARPRLSLSSFVINIFFGGIRIWKQHPFGNIFGMTLGSFIDLTLYIR